MVEVAQRVCQRMPKLQGIPLIKRKKPNSFSFGSIRSETLCLKYISFTAYLEALKVCILRESYRSLPEIHKSGCWEEK